MSPIGLRGANPLKRGPNRRDPCSMEPPAVARNHPSSVRYCYYTLNTVGEDVGGVDGWTDSVLEGGIGRGNAHADVGVAN